MLTIECRYPEFSLFIDFENTAAEGFFDHHIGSAAGAGLE
jgi:hypothetical protein